LRTLDWTALLDKPVSSARSARLIFAAAPRRTPAFAFAIFRDSEGNSLVLSSR
jgi:hypothetical protein